MTSHDTSDQSQEQQKNLNSLPQWAQDLILELMARVQELEAQIAKNSSKSDNYADIGGKCLRYMENRPGQFKYKEALEAELPIGSGEIESANRSVVQKRLKIAGAWWKPETAEYILTLRCMRINGDWERYWHSVSPTSFAKAA